MTSSGISYGKEARLQRKHTEMPRKYEREEAMTMRNLLEHWMRSFRKGYQNG